MPKIEISLKDWQDYRGNNKGIVLFTEPCLQAALPIRDELDDNGKGACHEPDYETGTYGLQTCHNQSKINAIVKAKYAYVFFAVKYAGLDDAFKGNYRMTDLDIPDGVTAIGSAAFSEWTSVISDQPTVGMLEPAA